MKVKFDIKSYQGEIDALKVNHYLQQLEFYFSFHHIKEEQKISFAWIKLEGHSLTWWESHTKSWGWREILNWLSMKTLKPS